MDFSEEQLIELYGWIDSIPLSRKKRNLVRDFSDAVLMAEVVSYFFPKSVDLFNYQQGLRVETKLYNWKHLNEKVLKKIMFPLDSSTIQSLANSKPGVIEQVLWKFKEMVSEIQEEENRPYFNDKEISKELEKFSREQIDKDRQLLTEKIQECEEQAEYIAALESKILKLEELMKLKDSKIEKLLKNSTKISNLK